MIEKQFSFSMKKYLNLPSVALLFLVVALASCGSSRSTTSRYPYPGSTYPYLGSTYPYPGTYPQERYPYPGTYPQERYPNQRRPVVVYRQPRKVYVPVDRRRNDRNDHWDNRNDRRYDNRRNDRDHDHDHDHRHSKNNSNNRKY